MFMKRLIISDAIHQNKSTKSNHKKRTKLTLPNNPKDR
jgi:hypothetical protein